MGTHLWAISTKVEILKELLPLFLASYSPISTKVEILKELLPHRL